MIEKPKFPPVLPLKAFTPTSESVRSEYLEYSSALGDETGKIIDETKRQAAIREAEQIGDTMEAKAHKEELSKSYLVYLAFRTNEGDSPLAKQLWADAFTEESINIYGAPEAALAKDLTQGQVAALSVEVTASGASRYRAAVEAMGIVPETGGQSPESNDIFGFEKSRIAMGEYLSTKYHAVYEAMAIDSHEGLFSPTDIADTFEAGLAALVAENPLWDGWKVDRRDDKDSLSVEAKSKAIIVGMKRAHASAEQVTGLFAHEVLRHALTAVNGAAQDDKLAGGLPGYLDFEEGMGVFHEYAMTGKLKDELIDRYTDIALALGYMNNSKKVPRRTLLEYALAREELRNELRGEYERLSPGDLQKKVYAHVNRIYRGTPGSDEVVGVYTKDIAYLEGFLKAGAYIEYELEQGKSMQDIMEYTTQGKFDPTQPEHAAYLVAKGVSTSSS